MNPQPLIETVVEKLDVSIYHSNQEMGKAVALVAAEIIKRAIQENGVANLIVATGNSQPPGFLGSLGASPTNPGPRL